MSKGWICRRLCFWTLHRDLNRMSKNALTDMSELHTGSPFSCPCKAYTKHVFLLHASSNQIHPNTPCMPSEWTRCCPLLTFPLFHWASLVLFLGYSVACPQSCLNSLLHSTALMGIVLLVRVIDTMETVILFCSDRLWLVMIFIVMHLPSSGQWLVVMTNHIPSHTSVLPFLCPYHV